MTNIAKGTYTIKSWEQLPTEVDDPTSERAKVVVQFEGDIQGAASIDYVMSAPFDGEVIYTGMVRFSGTVAEREGTMQLLDQGEFVGGNQARGTFGIVPGNGTDGLIGIEGKGLYMAWHGEGSVEYGGHIWQPTPERVATYRFEYDFSTTYDS